MEEIRLIQCKCGNWEEFPADMPRHASQSFDLVEIADDNQGVYKCNCGAEVTSTIIESLTDED